MKKESCQKIGKKKWIKIGKKKWIKTWIKYVKFNLMIFIESPFDFVNIYMLKTFGPQTTMLFINTITFVLVALVSGKIFYKIKAILNVTIRNMPCMK